MNSIYKTLRSETWIMSICLIGFVLRIKGLNYQSLWLDELHTMNEASPSASWGELFSYLKTSEHHPPLFFIAEKIFFSIFGHTAFVARLVPAIAGTISIWAIYRLGKELLNKSLGLICAVITCVNFFHLYYSQEARPYSFAFLFAALSFTWLIKLLRTPVKKNAIWYSVFTLFLLYTHYYSLFVIAAQAVLALLFILQEKGFERIKLIRYGILSAMIIVMGYIPWLSFLQATVAVKSFWITGISPAFIQNFFYDYFGNADILNPLLLFLLFTFFVKVAIHAELTGIKKIKDNPLLLGFTIILFWIFFVFLIPYVRSLLVVPMLFPRYTIVVLPAIILTLAYSIELFKIPLLKYSLLGFFVLLSVIHLFFVKKYYTAISKTQFREMTRYVVQENTSNFPIINENTAWQQGYYLQQFGSEAEIFSGKKEDLVDSILHKTSAKYNLCGFWIIGAHGDQMPDTNAFKGLDTAYSLIEQKTFYDAWAKFYASKENSAGGYYNIRYTDFAEHEGEILPAQKEIAIWNGAIHSKPLMLKKGHYAILISAMGTAAAQVFPHLNIYINGKKIRDYFVTGKIEENGSEFEISTDTNAVITVEMDNDITIPEKKEDRNVFLQNIVVKLIK